MLDRVSAPLRALCLALALLAGAGCAEADDPASRAVVLMYHHVGDDTPASTSVTPATFERHLEYLDRENFRVLPLSEVLEALEAGEALPPRTVAITFDDAYASVHSEAFPRLARRDWPFTVFVTTDYIDADYGNYLTWEQLREMSAAGVEIGNHTESHRNLLRMRTEMTDGQWRSAVRDEIEGAQRRLRQELGAAVKVLAYPYGEYDPELAEVVGDLGFYGLGQQSGVMSASADLLTAPRFPLAEAFADEQAFRTRVHARPLPVTVLAPRSPVLAPDRERPELRLRLGDGEFDPARLQCFASNQGGMQVSREGQRLHLRAERALPPGRSKYTCTVPHRSRSGIYYWYSRLWIKPRPDGSWPPE